MLKTLSDNLPILLQIFQPILVQGNKLYLKFTFS